MYLFVKRKVTIEKEAVWSLSKIMEKEKYIENFNPTFLFTWKGTRTHDEEKYHSHDFPELAYVLSGVGKYRIDDVIYDVKEGDLIAINPGVKHQALFTNPQNATTEFFVGFTDVKFIGLAPNMLPLPENSPIIPVKGELKQKISRICASMEAENSISWEGRYFMQKTYLMQMILLLLKEQIQPVEVKTGCAFESVNKKYVVEQMMNYFEEHYAEKISLDQIAENMYLSPFYISKIFKSETGNTPIHYLIKIRMERAFELLENGWEGSIQEVAVQVGYEDAYHFSKLFKKNFGVSPSQVKKGK